jgi:RNA polymerase sigma-70 factor, ECF subfamily
MFTGETMMQFDDIHRTYHDRVLKYLRGIVGDAHAEDVAQEVFIKVHRGLDSLKDQEKLSSWIFSIALNTARDAMRSLKSGVSVVDLDGGAGTPDRGPAIEQMADQRNKKYDEIIAKREMAQCYVDFVKKLPENYYDVYVLSEFEGLADAEIASRLSMSLQTVKIRLHRARTRLHEELRANCSCYCDSSGDLMCEPKK